MSLFLNSIFDDRMLYFKLALYDPMLRRSLFLLFTSPYVLGGFGASAHLVIQVARHMYPESKTFVFARSKRERDFARELSAFWAGKVEDESPEKLDCAIDTTPVWSPIVEILKNLDSGGRLVINAIRKEEVDKKTLMKLDYSRDL
jgi:propanol-preferring alcohol dehydrogenase